MSTLKQNILKVLAYFDIFKYPVSLDEIKFFLGQEAEDACLIFALSDLEEKGIIHKLQDFYSLKNDHYLLERRLMGNKKAEFLLPKAKRIARLMYYFPFVRGIGISGSLSKNYADENSDFDYFIITKKNRLWIASTLLGFLKKLSFLAGKQQWFCLNYYVDESCLHIQEKNIFTATELLTLITAKGENTLKFFLKANHWVNDFYPSYKAKSIPTETSSCLIIFKIGIEALLDNPIGNLLDTILMNQAISRWTKKKHSGNLVDLKGNEIQLPLTSKHFCKHNPVYFQQKVLTAYSERIDKLKRHFWPTSANKSTLAREESFTTQLY